MYNITGYKFPRNLNRDPTFVKWKRKFLVEIYRNEVLSFRLSVDFWCHRV